MCSTISTSMLRSTIASDSRPPSQMQLHNGRAKWRLASAAIVLMLAMPASNACAQFVQQGAKLVGTGGVGNAQQGWSVAISADGNTAIVGGPTDNGNGQMAGAAWVYTQSGGVWIQQGARLVGTGGGGGPMGQAQGAGVALSADGNTAVVGGPVNNNETGATWMFTRVAGVWNQQGAKLIGTGGVGMSNQGFSVAMSADGNTAIVGGYQDNSNAGAVWVFTRSAGAWSQEGAKLTGSDATAGAWQGHSVAVSSDGNTAVVGGPQDNGGVGAAWVFTRSAGVWSQQGAKLVGTGGLGQGYSVAVSSDGNTAVVGGQAATWVFTRSGGVWSQQGSVLVGTGSVGAVGPTSVAVSASGNAAIIGGRGDNTNVGAAWAFTRIGGVWTQLGSKFVGTGEVGPGKQGFSVAVSGDGKTAFVGGNSDNSFAGAVWVIANPNAVPSMTWGGALAAMMLMLGVSAYGLLRRKLSGAIAA